MTSASSLPPNRSRDAAIPNAPLLDLRGLHCPMPVLRTRKALRRMATGDRIVVLCTDPLAAIDIPHFLRTDGHLLEARSEAEGVACFTIRKGQPDIQ